VAQDLSEALKWYRKAAKQGHDMAQYYLGQFYEMGFGVAKSKVKATRWYRKSAKQKFRRAEEKLQATNAFIKFLSYFA
jgi:TPR repeat protein